MFKETDKISLKLGDAEVAFPAQVVLAALLSRLQGTAAVTRIVPAFGAPFEGGIYAGLTVVDNDPHELVLLPGSFKGPWAECVKWAEQQGGRLPSRIDQNVLFKNVKSEFEDAYYWSGEQYAGNDAYAWVQGFGGGGQNDFRKGGGCRCRAVRSLPIR